MKKEDKEAFEEFTHGHEWIRFQFDSLFFFKFLQQDEIYHERGWFYSWFAMTTAELKLTTYLTKFFYNVNNPILRYLCKFQVDIPIIARVTAIESLENLCTFILRQPCWWAKECTPTHFPI